MRDIGQTVRETKISGVSVSVTQPQGLLTKQAARDLIGHLSHASKIANDHLWQELEARYGAVVAQHIMSMMPGR
jgi:hypothetical protein